MASIDRDGTSDADPDGRPVSAPPRVLLEVIDGPHRGQRLEFDSHDTLLVGRGSAAQLRLAGDPHFSRHHFLLEVNPPDVLLRDLGSRNGTLVNGQSVRQCRLKPGDVISGGTTRIRFSLFDTQDVVGTADLPGAHPGAASSLGAVPTTAEHLPTLPGYEVERRLGRGGMGVVYQARHLASGDTVAVKVVVPESAASERALGKFFREARILSQLDHPRIVRFREMGVHLGRVYIVMEYIDTVDLPGLLAGKDLAGRARLACAVVCQALEGLHRAHELGFVHRDVKPANILVARGGSGVPPAAKVADFGLAKNFESAGLSGLTHEGGVLGTLPFMAPEQVVSARDARPAVDVYSAGATLYHMLAESYPYEFPKSDDPLRIILEDPVVPLDRRRPGLPAGLAEVAHTALAKKPQDRYPTAAAFRQALLPFAGRRSSQG